MCPGMYVSDESTFECCELKVMFYPSHAKHPTPYTLAVSVYPNDCGDVADGEVSYGGDNWRIQST